ncbi:hypothetical protein TCEL_00305 [Thermobrachium celere DSM 8682]|uniref:Uncharacterized protein n=1 Tax=Thermobrachium celere DSM 8682 TaxID=941824 RepID=R7RQA4_9CLOT|nr:hypothetical protein TCEL_00305 [Thermobrachium celere DSM 8682]
MIILGIIIKNINMNTTRINIIEIIAESLEENPLFSKCFLRGVSI